VTDFIHPEAVFMLHGFGREVPATTRCNGKGASDTALQGNVTDMIGGSPGLHETFVKVRPFSKKRCNVEVRLKEWSDE
jgi:thiosulfate reductase / polysulfide reductase chain A